MRILVVGAGAKCGYFGAWLARAGRDVTFLVRARRAQLLERCGLRITGLGEETVLCPRVIRAGSIDAPYGVVLLGVKATGLEHAVDDMAAAVGPHSLVAPVLNGFRHADVLAACFPMPKGDRPPPPAGPALRSPPQYLPGAAGRGAPCAQRCRVHDRPVRRHRRGDVSQVGFHRRPRRGDLPHARLGRRGRGRSRRDGVRPESGRRVRSNIPPCRQSVRASDRRRTVATGGRR